MTMPDLLPCPFCGSEPDWKRWEVGGIKQIKIFCDGEGCHLHPSIFGNEETMIKIWNTRADLAQPPSAENGEALIEWLDFGIKNETLINTKGARETLLAIRRALSAPSVPQDWVLVPREPTENMIKAVLNNIGKWPHNSDGSVSVREQFKSDYKAMIAAAPQNTPAGRSADDNKTAAMSLHGDPDDNQVRGVDIEKLREALTDYECASDAILGKNIDILAVAARAYLEMREKRNEQI